MVDEATHGPASYSDHSSSLSAMSHSSPNSSLPTRSQASSYEMVPPVSSNTRTSASAPQRWSTAEDQCGSRPYRHAIPIRVDGSYISLRQTLHEERAEFERTNGAQWSAPLWKFGLLKPCQFTLCPNF